MSLFVSRCNCQVSLTLLYPSHSVYITPMGILFIIWSLGVRLALKLRVFLAFVPRSFVQATTPPNIPVPRLLWKLRAFPAFVLQLHRKQQRRQTFQNRGTCGNSGLSRLSFSGCTANHNAGQTFRYRGTCENSGLSQLVFRGLSSKPQRRKTFRLLVPCSNSGVSRLAFCGLS